MRIAGILAAALALAGCERPKTWAPTEPPDVFLHWPDRMKERFPELQTIFGPSCIWKRAGSVPVDQCFKMEAPQRWRGLWRYEGEGSWFCPKPVEKCTRRVSGPWWALVGDRPKAEALHIYEIEFLGRRTTYPLSYLMVDHNHLILVDRLIAIRDLGEL